MGITKTAYRLPAGSRAWMSERAAMRGGPLGRAGLSGRLARTNETVLLRADSRPGRPARANGPPHIAALPQSDARGSALLAVLWLSLALSTIAFSVASTVQGETERTSTAVDGLRSYYLATGAIERAILYMQWGKQAPPSAEGDSPYYFPGKPVLRMSFPTGDVEVDVIPET